MRIHRPCDSSLPKERSYNSTDQSLFLVNPLAKRRSRLAHRLGSVSVLSPRNPGEQRLGSHVPKNRAGVPVGNNRHILTYSFTWMRTDHVFGCHGQQVARTFRSGVGFEQLGFFRRVCDRDIALVRSDELVDEIRKAPCKAWLPITTNSVSPVISLAALTRISQCPSRNAHGVPIRQLPDRG